MCDRRLVAFFVAFWVTNSVSQAGFMTDPDPDPDGSEIVIRLGEPSVDMPSGFVDFPISLHFGSDWFGQSLSFVGINVEETWVNGQQLGSDSPLFSRFLFLPTPESDLATWGVSSEYFGGGSTAGLEEWIGDPDIDPLPAGTEEMSIGTLRFDFDLTGSMGSGGSIVPGGLFVPGGLVGLASIDFLEVGLGGGMGPSTDSEGTRTVVGLLDKHDQFRFVEPRRIPDSLTVNLEPASGTHVVPEPSRGVTIALAISCVLAVTRRHRLRNVQ